MTQQSAKKEYVTFVRGIITEAGPLTFPENASLDEANCVLNRDGSRQRRLGMDLETNYVLRSISLAADDAVASFRWENAANSTDNQFAVVQAGKRLLVFNANTQSISAELIAEVDLSAYITGKSLIQVASGLGYLFITEGSTTPLYLSYNPATKAISVNTIDIRIRDFLGVDDGLAVDEQPNSISNAHRYNLYNQGWDATKVASYNSSVGAYPSNAQIWYVGKDSNDDFDPALLKKIDFGTSQAPRGRYIINAFNRSASRTALSGVSVPDDTELNRPTCVGFAFERVFYSGIESSVSVPNGTSPNMTGWILFSRTIKSPQDFGKCYSAADPTSEHDSELVDTDGGYVNIPDSGKIYKLVPKLNGIVILAERGVWFLTGDEGGFRGTSYQVRKISDFGCISATSVIDAEEGVFYWNRGGIYLLSPNESGELVSENISEATIQTLYNDIKLVSRRHAVGTIDPVNRRVMWMYNDEDDYDGVNYKHKFTKELVLDLVLTAFYKNTISSISDPSPYIAGYIETPDVLLREDGVRGRGESVTKYLVVQYIDRVTSAAAVSFAYYKDPRLRDWRSIDGQGASYESYMITGYEIMQDTARQKQATYITTHLKQTETEVELVNGEPRPVNPSGCLLQARWDWSNSPNSGKWGEPQQVYSLQKPYVLKNGENIDYGFEVVSTKRRLPGRGKALSLKFSSDGDKDFYLYGWAINFTGNSYV